MAFENKEELVVVVVFVPVVLTLHDAKANDRIVHFAEGLVVPTVRAGGDQRGNVDYAQLRELNIEVRGVRMRLCITHDASPRELPNVTGVAGATRFAWAETNRCCASDHWITSSAQQ